MLSDAKTALVAREIRSMHAAVEASWMPAANDIQTKTSDAFHCVHVIADLRPQDYNHSISNTLRTWNIFEPSLAVLGNAGLVFPFRSVFML